MVYGYDFDRSYWNVVLNDDGGDRNHAYIDKRYYECLHPKLLSQIRFTTIELIEILESENEKTPQRKGENSTG